MRGVLLSIVSCAAAALSLSGVAHAQTLNDLYPELATLVASDGAANDQLGTVVSLDGDTLAVGMPLDDVGTVVDQGSVRVFVRSGSLWTLQATLTASDGLSADAFGSSVSLSGDTLAVGVPLDDVGTVSNQGSVRIFVRSGTTWTAQQTLTASDGAAGDKFGSSVALDGDTLAVGVPSDSLAIIFQGSVRVFTRSGVSWTAQATLTASDGEFDDGFGSAVSLSGNTLAVGVPDDKIGTEAEQGSVRVFVRSNSVWAAQATLVHGGERFHQFGASVSLADNTLVVGVPGDGNILSPSRGSARVFARSGTTWTEQASLTGSAPASDDQFGFSVSLSGDTVAVGTPGDDIGTTSNQGSVRVFVRSGSTWALKAVLTSSDGAASDSFGSSVSLSDDTLAVGVPIDDVDARFWFTRIVDPRCRNCPPVPTESCSNVTVPLSGAARSPLTVSPALATSSERSKTVFVATVMSAVELSAIGSTATKLKRFCEASMMPSASAKAGAPTMRRAPGDESAIAEARLV